MTRAPFLLLSVVVLVGAGSAGEPAGPGNPHGEVAACDACHAPMHKGDPPTAIAWAGDGPIATCERCHDYEHHEINLVPEATAAPKSFPLYDGRVVCHTCHDEPACDGDPVSPDAPLFLRGGPYVRISAFCAECHQASTPTEPFNLHSAMTGPEGARTCDFCHLEPADPSQRVGPMRLASVDLCKACHSTAVHAGAAVHVGKVPAAMQQEATEARLPLAEDGTMGCITCHDPHPAGVREETRLRTHWIGKETVDAAWRDEVETPSLTARGEALGLRLSGVTVEPDLLRLPVRNGRLCLACHSWRDITPETKP